MKSKNPLFRPFSRLTPLQTVDMAIRELEKHISHPQGDASALTVRIAAAIQQKLDNNKTASDRCQDILRRGLSSCDPYSSAADMLLDLRRVRVGLIEDETIAAREKEAARQARTPLFIKLSRPLALTAWILFCTLTLSAAGVAVHYLYPNGLFLREVEVPALVGENLRQTEPDPEVFALDVTYQFHPDAPSGQILSQSPSAGMIRRVSARHPCTLSLTVSLGQEQVLVGDFCGMTRAQAEMECRRLGLIPVIKKQSGHPVGNVARTEPAAGEILFRGAEIVLYVGNSTHSGSVAVPNMVGISEVSAVGMLTSLGLSRGEVSYMNSDAKVGTVIAQSVVSGTVVGAGTRVSIVVSKGRG